MQQKQFSVAWMRLRISICHLGLPLEIMEQSEKNSNFYWNLIKLYSTQNGYGQVYPIRNVTACKLMEESVIKGIPSNYSIYPSQLKYQMKKLWLKASVLYEQLLSSVPYTTLYPICNCMFMVFVYWTIHQLLWSKTDFFLQIY